MAQFEFIAGDEGYLWRLLDDGTAIGVSHGTFADVSEARMAVLLARVAAAAPSWRWWLLARPSQFKTKIVKNAAGKFEWLMAIKHSCTHVPEPFAKSAGAFADRGSCSKAATHFKSLLPDAGVLEAPSLPKVVFTAEATADGTPLTIDFDSSSSHSPGSSVIECAWDFGDGSHGVGRAVRHAYAAAGQFMVALTVRDRKGAEATASRAVTVTAPVEPEPSAPELEAPALDLGGVTRMREATEFLYKGKRALQSDVAEGAIKPHRAAVVRGRVSVRDASGARITPAGDVLVRVKDHPELGIARTRANGAFDMAVNGGSTFTLIFEKIGFLTVRRRITIPWEDYVPAPTVVLTPLSLAIVTKLDLRADGAMQSASGREITLCPDGRRQARLLMPGGLKISSTESSAELDLTAPNIGVVEYTDGRTGLAAMPSALPANSGLTYAVDFSVNGADGVQFDRPAIHYVENFLNFPVGSPVPSGYFDTSRDCWLPAKNGRVIEIVGVSDGMAQIDLDGKGPANPRKMREFGLEEEELRELARLYRPGQSLWRVEVGHFSAWDFNWPFGPPPDATTPDTPDPRDPEQEANEDEPDPE